MAIDEAVVTIVASTVLFSILVVIIFVIVGLFQRRRIRFLQETAQLKLVYEKEILNSQIEIQNQTLQQVSQDLHDNIGQLLTLAKMQLSMIEDVAPEGHLKERVSQTYAVVGEAIHGVRSITKSLDSDFVKDFGLIDSLTHELDRIHKTLQLKTELVIADHIQSVGFQREIVVFRIIQELINNSLKYANASKLTISLDWHPDKFKIVVQDDGRGFNYAEVMNRSMSNSGAGIRNIQNRLKLINGTCDITTGVGQGTRVEIRLNDPGLSDNTSLNVTR